MKNTEAETVGQTPRLCTMPVRIGTANVSAMPTIKCPVCGMSPSPIDVVEMAVHLMDRHDWDYEQAADWLRDEEEKKCATS